MYWITLEIKASNQEEASKIARNVAYEGHTIAATVSMADCQCSFEWERSKGVYQVGTGIWQPDMDVAHVSFLRAPECPVHWMTHWYLNEPVRLLEDLGDGWCITRWENGKEWRQWLDQLNPMPSLVRRLAV